MQTATTTGKTKQTSPKRHISEEVLRMPQSIRRTNRQHVLSEI